MELLLQDLAGALVGGTEEQAIEVYTLPRQRLGRERGRLLSDEVCVLRPRALKSLADTIVFLHQFEYCYGRRDHLISNSKTKPASAE